MPTHERYQANKDKALAAYKDAIASGKRGETGGLFDDAVETHVPLEDLYRVDLENMEPEAREAYINSLRDTHGFSRRFQNQQNRIADKLADEFGLKG